MNEVDIGAQLMRTDQVNVVVGPKILDRLSVNTDVEVCRTCTVDGVDVSHWADAAVLSDGAGQTITAPVQFDSAVFADRLVVDGQLNGVTVDRHQLMTLDDDQIVSGRISLTAHPPTSDDITRHGDQYENSTQQFQLAARVQNMTVLGLYDGVNLTRFYDNAVRIRRFRGSECEVYNHSYESIKSLMDIMDVRIEGFEVSKERVNDLCLPLSIVLPNGPIYLICMHLS